MFDRIVAQNPTTARNFPFKLLHNQKLEDTLSVTTTNFVFYPIAAADILSLASPRTSEEKRKIFQKITLDG